MRFSSFLCGSLVAVALAAGCNSSDKKMAGKVQTFGEPMKLSTQAPLPITQVLADTGKYEGKFIKVSGVATEVCKEEGCWINMKDPASGKLLFVKFSCPSEGRLIPLAAEGRPVTVEGTLKVKEVSEADARHFASEGGKSAEEVAKIVGPQKQVSLSSPSAAIVMP
jgi:Domain of unknown function (DUF4920)